MEKKFKTHDEAKRYVEDFEKKNFVQLWVAHSRTIEGARKRGFSRHIRQELKYTEIIYRCIHGGNRKESRSTGIRPNQSSYRQGCPFLLKLKAATDGESLEVVDFINEHNHDHSKTWTDLKHKVREKSAKIKKIQSGTGGGIVPYEELTSFEQKVLNLIGHAGAFGDSVVEEGGSEAPKTSRITEEHSYLNTAPLVDVIKVTELIDPVAHNLSISSTPRGTKTCHKARQPRRKAAAKGHKLPELIPEGKEITDTQKKTWVMNKIIGSGGFGTVYYAALISKPKNFDYVVKVEYHENGPLFAEMHCYQKVAKPTTISDWVKSHKLEYLGLSPCHGFGSFEHNGSKYRFMVLERFDKDLQKLFEENGKRFPLKTVCLIGLSVIDVLEYIHSFGYVHGDVKAANLLTGRKVGTENQVYLVDMGLACKYVRDGTHKKDLPDPKKAHNGTPEFTSRDAHRGSFSRRSDLEILCFNLLQWLSGRLPWEDFISDNNKLQKEKERHMTDVNKFLKALFPDKPCPSGISKFLNYVNDLGFEEEPNYSHCKKLLKDDLKSIGCTKDNTLEFATAEKPTRATSTRVNPVPEQVSNKENGKQQKARKIQVKRKAKDEIEFEDGMVLTPAMQEVLNKKQNEKPKSKKK